MTAGHSCSTRWAEVVQDQRAGHWSQFPGSTGPEPVLNAKDQLQRRLMTVLWHQLRRTCWVPLRAPAAGPQRCYLCGLPGCAMCVVCRPAVDEIPHRFGDSDPGRGTPIAKVGRPKGGMP